MLGYLIYFLLTWFWLDPRVAVTILYPVGVFIAYLGHSKYSFTYTGSHRHGLARFLLAYFIGYVVNITLLYLFSDILGFAHQFVQAGAIVVIAGTLFLLLRYFVFPQR
jgi:putative flippase GtrA